MLVSVFLVHTHKPVTYRLPTLPCLLNLLTHTIPIFLPGISFWLHVLHPSYFLLSTSRPLQVSPLQVATYRSPTTGYPLYVTHYYRSPIEVTPTGHAYRSSPQITPYRSPPQVAPNMLPTISRPCRSPPLQVALLYRSPHQSLLQVAPYRSPLLSSLTNFKPCSLENRSNPCSPPYHHDDCPLFHPAHSIPTPSLLSH